MQTQTNIENISEENNDTPKKPKESFRDWQDRVADNINTILDKKLDLEKMINHHVSLTNSGNLKSSEEKTEKMITDSYQYVKEKENIEHKNIENNFLYNIPNIITYLYQNMGTKTNKIVIALAKVYSKQTGKKYLNIDWNKYNSKLPKEFKKHCETKEIPENYVKYLLGKSYLKRHLKHTGRKKKNKETKSSFTELLQNSSLFRKGIEEQFFTIERVQEVEYIRFLVNKSLSSIPNLREVSYKGWLNYMGEGVKKEIENIKKDQVKENQDLKKINTKILNTYKITETIKKYLETGKLNITKLKKEKKEDVYTAIEIKERKRLEEDKKTRGFNKEKIKQLEKDILDIFEKAKKSTDIKNKVKEVLKQYDNYDDLKYPLNLKTNITYYIERKEETEDEIKELEDEVKHLEEKFEKELFDEEAREKYKNPISLKKAIEAKKWKQDFKLKKEMKDYTSLDFSEEQAIRQLMSVISKFKKEETEDGLRDNIPNYFLQSKAFTCFSGTWLVASLLKEIGFKEKDIFIGLGSVGDGGIIYKHAYVLLRKSNGDYLKIDYGFLEIENMNPKALNNLIKDDFMDYFRKGFNSAKYDGYYHNQQGMDRLGQVYRLNDGLSVGYLTNHAGLLFNEKKYDEAKELLYTCLAIDHQNIDALETLMYIAEKENNVENIKKYASRLIKVMKYMPTAHYLLGKLAFNEGDYELAKEKLELFKKLDKFTRKPDKTMLIKTGEMLKEIKEKIPEKELTEKEIGRIIEKIHKVMEHPDEIPLEYRDLKTINRKKVLNGLKNRLNREKDLKEKSDFMFYISSILAYEVSENTDIGRKANIKSSLNLTF